MAFLSETSVQLVIITSIENRKPLTRRCNSDKAHFSQIIKSKARMNGGNIFFNRLRRIVEKRERVALGDGVPGCAL